MGTHPIFESDFDCLTEWVDRDHVRASVSEVAHQKRSHRRAAIDHDHHAIDAKDRDRAIVIDDAMNTIDEGMIDARGDAHVIVMAVKAVVVRLPKRERIQSVGWKLLPSQSNHPTVRPSWVKWSCFYAKMSCQKQPKTFDNYAQWRKVSFKIYYSILDHRIYHVYEAMYSRDY